MVNFVFCLLASRHVVRVLYPGPANEITGAHASTNTRCVIWLLCLIHVIILILNSEHGHTCYAYAKKTIHLAKSYEASSALKYSYFM